jgi:hypothetical protein
MCRRFGLFPTKTINCVTINASVFGILLVFVGLRANQITKFGSGLG